MAKSRATNLWISSSTVQPYPKTYLEATTQKWGSKPLSRCRKANNIIPDSIITNMTCWSLVPLVESKVSSTKMWLTSKNTHTYIEDLEHDRAHHQGIHSYGHGETCYTRRCPQPVVSTSFCATVDAPSTPSQIARLGGDKLRSTYRMKIGWPTEVCDRQEWRNDHDTDILTPHNPTTVDLWRFRWITDDRYNASDLCVLECIGRGSYNNRLVWFGQSKCESTLAVSQFEKVERSEDRRFKS